ncbi:Hypothetical predicted protein [Mytilus galloprovincialis]|nr:Hypothetical predicted protein [Mytilus galloprovincialis]
MMNMKSIFARHGIPEVLVSDNARYYTSSKFQEFAKSWEFKHITSSPRYQQSNGLAERTVQTVKQLLKKADYEGKDPYMSILNFRNTPLDSDMPSPSQLLMGRRCKTKLPITKKLLRTEVPENAKKTFVKKQEKQKLYYDKKTKELSKLNVNDNVYVQREKRWEPAVVVQNTDNSRSYIVKTENDKLYRRNRKHLMENKNNVVIENDDLDDIVQPNTVRNEVNDYNRTRSGRMVRKPERLIENMN